MKQPYIRKYQTIAGFDVWIVNGAYIRENIDDDFTNYSHHYKFNFIPENELWIDKNSKEGEIPFYIDSMIYLIQSVKSGKTYEESIKISDKVEKRERAKDKLMRNFYRHKKQDVMHLIHKKLLKNYSKKINIWVVNGEAVRDLFFLDFTEGGHDKVYPFIPRNEIWIDDDVSPKERDLILLHEVVERNLMCHGWQYDPADNRSLIKKVDKSLKIYKSAHQRALEVEHFCHKHTKRLKPTLVKEINKLKII